MAREITRQKKKWVVFLQTLSNNAFIGNVDAVKSKNFYGAFIALPKEMKNSIKFVNNQFTNNGENIHWVETN